MIKLAVCGAAGRMGNAIMRIAIEKGHQVVAAFDSSSSPHYGAKLSDLIPGAPGNVVLGSIEQSGIQAADGVIDFSAPSATMELLDAAVKAETPIVIGTTGIDIDGRKKIEKAASVIPVFFSPNMSVGVNLLFRLTELAAKVLSSGFDVELLEAHHRFKKDAPSGTAKRLIEIIKDAQGDGSDALEIYDRSGISDGRKDKELGVMVMRGGDIVGEHTVFFVGAGERVELTHRATNRDIFARGAVLALEFIVKRKPGLYTMYDVLGI